MKLTAQAICEGYVAAFNARDLEALRALFTPDGVVVHPVEGEVPFEPFFRPFFDGGKSATLELVSTFQAVNGTDAAVYMRGTWHYPHGAITLPCADIFECDAASGKIRRLTAIFDGGRLRAHAAP